MATPMAIKRLTKEFKDLENDPVPYIEAHPSDSNILNWYFILTGPPDTPYVGGSYMGMLMFDKNYPFEPPGIKVITPSGRFVPNNKICLSISDFHRETWNPSFSVGTILNGLLSFMTSEESTTGAMRATDKDRGDYARRSHDFNKGCKIFNNEFPDYYEIKAKSSLPAARSIDEFRSLKSSNPSSAGSSFASSNQVKPRPDNSSLLGKIGNFAKRKPSDDNQLNKELKRSVNSNGKQEVNDVEAEEQEEYIRENKDIINLLDSGDEDDFNFFDDGDNHSDLEELLELNEEETSSDTDLVEITEHSNTMESNHSSKKAEEENEVIVID